MCKKFVYLISFLLLSFAFTNYVSAGIIYVDATDGEAGNTQFVTGEVFAPTDPGTSGSGADGTDASHKHGKQQVSEKEVDYA